MNVVIKKKKPSYFEPVVQTPGWIQEKYKKQILLLAIFIYLVMTE